MTKFIAKKQVPFCSKRELNEFVDALVAGWEANERTQAEVHERADKVMAAAVKGELTTNGKAIWAKTLGGKLRAAGCFMTEAPGKKAQIDESFL